jgi:DNA modification methylase
MDGHRASLFATDPPYLVGYDGTNHPGAKGKRNKNKNWSGSYGVTWDDAEANPELYDRFIGVAIAEAISPNAAWYCWHASRRQAMVEAVWEKHGAFVHQQIVWAKDRRLGLE